MKTQMTIVNEQEFLNWMNSLVAGASGESLDEAVFAGALEVKNQIDANIVKVHLIDTGNLRNSIDAHHGMVSKTQAEANTGTPVPYAAIHEFGGVIKQDNAWGKGIKQTIHMPARPYMRPAVDEHKDEIVDKIGQVIVMNLEKARG
jgi:phage gpG-like protein